MDSTNKDDNNNQDVDDAGSLDAQETTLQNAITKFDVNAVKKVIEDGLDIKTTWLDSRKYRNALHELALVYMSYNPYGENYPFRYHHIIDRNQR